jgi:acyl-[acyl-carrier-protein] desaturase
VTDQTGEDKHAWARWSRAWTAEEKRHGDVTRAYLMLGGRVAMGEVERTIQHLLRNGFDTGADGDPYRGLAYAGVQEHATKTSWNQLGRVVGRVGAPRLHRMCGLIAADEARHERVYRHVLFGVLERDPEGGLDALRDVIGRVAMPARLMGSDGGPSLFRRFAAVGAKLGVYSLRDYADNVEGLLEEAGIAHMGSLGPEGARLQDELCAMPERYRRQADAGDSRRHHPVPFPWIHNRRA